MLELFQEAGFAAWLCTGLFIAGVAMLAIKRANVTPYAVAIVAAGVMGQGLGMRLVSKAAEGAPSLAEKVTYLSLGSKEAAANLIIGGVLALILLAVAGVAAKVRGSATPTAP